MTPPFSTPFTAVTGCRVPVVQAGMSWVSSNWELPLAVSQAGGLGVVAAGPLRVDDLGAILAELRKRTQRPWAVNLPLYRKGAEEIIDLLLDAAPPVLIASQGGPRRYLDAFQKVGTRCFHVVASLEHARKAADAGVDGLIVVGGEAGGHPPPSGVTSMVLTRQVCRDIPEIPVVLSGGVADGFGLAAALSLGASAAQFGTRFLATRQARVHPSYQQRVLEAGSEDAITVGRGLGQIRTLRNEFAEHMLALEEAGVDDDERLRLFREHTLRDAAVNGDLAQGKVEAGQTAGLVHDIRDAGDLVRQIAEECHQVVRGLGATLAPAAR